MSAPFVTPTPTKPVQTREQPASGETPAPRGASFPKRARILRPADFRRVYAEGAKVSGPYFAAFCLRRAETEGPKIGFTAPRALGKAVVRNRIKRRMREAVRRQLFRLEPQWEIVINPRRSAFAAPMEDLAREIERLFSRCKP